MFRVPNKPQVPGPTQPTFLFQAAMYCYIGLATSLKVFSHSQKLIHCPWSENQEWEAQSIWRSRIQSLRTQPSISKLVMEAFLLLCAFIEDHPPFPIHKYGQTKNPCGTSLGLRPVQIIFHKANVKHGCYELLEVSRRFLAKDTHWGIANRTRGAKVRYESPRSKNYPLHQTWS